MRSAIGDDYQNGPGSTEASGWRKRGNEDTGSHWGGTQTPGSTIQLEPEQGVSDFVRANPYWMNADGLKEERAPTASVPVNNAENPQGLLLVAQNRDQVGNLLDPVAASFTPPPQRNGVHNITSTWTPESAARMHASMYGRPPSMHVAPPPGLAPPQGFPPGYCPLSSNYPGKYAYPTYEQAGGPGSLPAFHDTAFWVGEAHETTRPGFNEVLHNVADGEPTKTPPVEFVPMDRPLKVQYPLSAMMGGVERMLDAEEAKFVMVCHRLTELLGMFRDEMENPVLKVRFGKEMERVMDEVTAIERVSRITKLRKTNVIEWFDYRDIWEDKCYGEVGAYKRDVLSVKLSKKVGVVVAEKELCYEEESTDCDSSDYDSIETIIRLPPSIVKDNPSVAPEPSVKFPSLQKPQTTQILSLLPLISRSRSTSQSSESVAPATFTLPITEPSPIEESCQAEMDSNGKLSWLSRPASRANASAVVSDWEGLVERRGPACTQAPPESSQKVRQSRGQTSELMKDWCNTFMVNHVGYE
ncbi:hypothetical protein YB2330_005932 [Saitoella coloradoensis]